MFGRLSVYDINRRIEEKKAKQMAAFNKIYDMCQKQIVKHCDSGKLKFIYDVPEFVIGMSTFNLNSVIIYLMDELTKHGFLVRYFFPKFLYISWDVDEIQTEKTKQDIKNLAIPIPKSLPLPQRQLFSMPNSNGKSLQKTMFPPPPMATRAPPALAFTSSQPKGGVNGGIIMPHTPEMNLPLPSMSSNSLLAQSQMNNLKPPQNQAFLKSISEFKPSGKFVLDLR
jgi:hypothetical protein